MKTYQYDNIPLFCCARLKIGKINCRSNKMPVTVLKGTERTVAALIITRCYWTQEPRIYCIHNGPITADTEGYSLPEGRQGGLNCNPEVVDAEDHGNHGRPLKYPLVLLSVQLLLLFSVASGGI